jgi:glutamyl-tRNA synthetase
LSPVPRLRFAPSPTGYLHVGGARTALFNWLYARKHGGQFLLRVEDTDKARSTDESTRAIFEGLQWLGLTWDEDVVHQGDNVARHRADAERMLASGHAYRCFCTPAELDERRKEAEAAKSSFKYDRRCDRLDPAEVARRVAAGEVNVVRFRVPEGVTSWTDLVHGDISFPNKDIEDFVVLRSDSTPIYNMAVVSDDIAMRITLVMRGDDHISNTPKQILLYRALGAELPQFAHLPMIHGSDGKKLSKRHGATAVADWQHEGILPQTMVNFLALLGWSPGGEFDEVMTIDELVAKFDADGLRKTAAVFDVKKLEWMNGQHITRMPIAELMPLVTSLLVDGGLASAVALDADAERYRRTVDGLRSRVRSIKDLAAQVPTYLLPITYDDAIVRKAWSSPREALEIIRGAHATVDAATGWEPESIEQSLRATAESRGVGVGKVLGPVRMALTGSASSPSISEVMRILGRDESLARLGAAERHLAALDA